MCVCKREEWVEGERRVTSSKLKPFKGVHVRERRREREEGGYGERHVHTDTVSVCETLDTPADGALGA